MRGFLLFFILLFFASPGYSQDKQQIDNLRYGLDTSEEAERINMLYDIAWEYRNSYPDSTIYYSTKALNLARKEDKTLHQAKALNFIGIAHHYKGDYISSFEYLSQALATAKELNDSIQLGHSYNTLGRLFMSKGAYVKAYQYFFDGKKIFEAQDDKKGLSYVYKSLAELYQKQNKVEQSFQMLENALLIRNEIGDRRGEISILNELADLHLQHKDFDEALIYFNQAREIAINLDDKINIAEINNGLACLYFDQENYDKAKTYSISALKIVGNTDNKDLLTKIFLLQGKSNYELGEFRESENNLLRVIDIAEGSNNYGLEMNAYEYLSKIEEEKGNTEGSYEYFKKYVTLKESLDDADKARQIEQLEARIEIEKREQENELLLALQERNNAVIETQKMEIMGLILISIIVTAFMILLWFTAKNRRRANKKLQIQKERIALQKAEIDEQNDRINQQNQKLQKRNDDLLRLNEEKDNLMNIMAHDLKGPLNRIVGLSELVRMTSSKENETRLQYLNMIKEVSIGGISLIRDLLDVHSFEGDRKGINYSEIDIEDLINNKIKDFKKEISDKDIKITTEFSHGDVEFLTDEMFVSRIMDNLLSNAIKFSNASSEIFISSRTEGENMVLSIKDEGQGFSEEDKKSLFKKFKKLSAQPTAGESSNGLGLAIVKTLIDQLRGSIRLVSKKGEGSEFILYFPLNRVAVVDN